MTVPSMFHIHSYYLEGGQWQAAVTVDKNSGGGGGGGGGGGSNKCDINTAHVECKKKQK
jgi:hypothetical protein